MISKKFPVMTESEALGITKDTNSEFPAPCQVKENGSCSCPIREPPPEPPMFNHKLSVDELKKLIVGHYASSAFNRCTKQPLPGMTGEPMPIITDPDVRPVAAHTPISVPIHWEEQVKADLDRVVALGIIEQVPINTPTTWCAHMVVVPKHDGSPRRTVDFKALINASSRQTHHIQTPFIFYVGVESPSLPKEKCA